VKKIFLGASSGHPEEAAKNIFFTPTWSDT
jgi:hypothetical protein